ncbi:MAG: class I adenylate-forming enzyme family protein [Xanthomonadales bacterium]|nr:class I adenylate-forming enzyme family protein [Xanthomonadales bacterium]
MDDLRSSRIRATTLGDMLLTAADQFPDTEAVIFPDERITYQQLAERALRTARSLRALGVGGGDHVGILLPTCSEFLDALFGATLLGAVVVPVNARFRPPEITYVCENADLKVLLTSHRYVDTADFVPRVMEALPGLADSNDPARLDLAAAPKLTAVVSLSGDDVDGLLNRAAFDSLAGQVSEDEVHLRRLQTRLGSTALILYTSGTTSNPKGCMISHESMVRSSIALGRRYQLGGEDKFWSPLPMFHIAAILPLVSIFDVGGTYLTAEHFDAGASLSMLETEKVTATYPCFWTIMGDLVQHPDFANADLGAVRLMNANFAVQPDMVWQTMEQAMPDTVYVGTFGMTETAGTVTTSRISDSREQRFTRLGTPMPGLEVRILNPENGEEAAVGEKGECLIRGYSTFTEYYKSPEKTAEALDADGWFHSGDICSLDADGQLMFHGRLKDMLKVGGENVAAAEIEACLEKHDAVRMAQVVGVPDPRYQEVAAAFVELNEGHEPDRGELEQALMAHCKERMAGFKVPRYVRFITEWPMSSTKIQKFKLAEDLIEELGQT